MYCETPDVQDGFKKGRGTRDQTANICWFIEKARELQKNTYLCFIKFAKAFDCVDYSKLWKTYRDWNTRPSFLSSEISVCRSGSNSKNWTWNKRLVPNRKRSTSRLYTITLLIYYMQRNAGLNEAQLQSRLLGEISITTDSQLIPPLWQKAKKN